MRTFHSPGSSWAKLKRLQRNSGMWWIKVYVLWDSGEEIGDPKDLERTLTTFEVPRTSEQLRNLSPEDPRWTPWAERSRWPFSHGGANSPCDAAKWGQGEVPKPGIENTLNKQTKMNCLAPGQPASLSPGHGSSPLESFLFWSARDASHPLTPTL